METTQTQQLMPERELVRIRFESNHVSWSVYEGVVDGEDSFVVQHYCIDYPTSTINSWRCRRNLLEYDFQNKIVTLDEERAHLVRYDINNPKNNSLALILREKGIWRELLRI